MHTYSHDSEDDSDNESFHSADDHPRPPLPARRLNLDKDEEVLKDESTTVEKFLPEEEAALLTESNATKSSANALFARAAFSDAISTYDRALSSCPNYLEYEVAVLRNNIAACHIKLQEWKAAVEAASKALDCLQRLDPVVRQEKGKEDSVVEEVDDATADRIERLGESGHTRDEVQKMRVKALLRRGRGNLEIGGWAALQAAEDDYKQLSAMPELSKPDRETVQRELTMLPVKLENAKQREMSDMMAKLKDLGNGILKPFGFSTDNFNFVKDPNTGGYSMGFNQGGQK